MCWGHNIFFRILCRFAGNMERQQADNLLKSHSSGTYLIRERTAEAERFAISIKWVFHILQQTKISREDFNPHPRGNKNSHGVPHSTFSVHLLAPANYHSVIAFLLLFALKSYFLWESTSQRQINYELLLELSNSNVLGEEMLLYICHQVKTGANCCIGTNHIKRLS